jgi:phage FluMu protein Com
MIEFSCKKCCQKLIVQEQHSGKRVKCPRCGTVGFLPDNLPKIKFNCQKCGQSICVPQIQAGKKGKCPKCKNIIVVPTLNEIPVNIENKKQNHQKPPLNRCRIACEILAGTAAGLAVVPLVCVACIVYQRYELFGKGDVGVFEFMALFVIVCPLLYGLASGVGVYLVGTRGKQTGSFILTFGFGFFGGILFMGGPLSLALFLSAALIVGVEMKVLCVLLVFILLIPIPSIMATLGFNLTRRYKEPPSA